MFHLFDGIAYHHVSGNMQLHTALARIFIATISETVRLICSSATLTEFELHQYTVSCAKMQSAGMFFMRGYGYTCLHVQVANGMPMIVLEKLPPA